LVKLLPILHHNLHTQPLESLGHLLLLLASAIAANIPNDRNASTDSTQSPALAVLNSHTLSRLLPNDLARVQVDSWIRLGRWRLERSGSRKDMVWGEEVILANFLDAGLHTPQRTAAHNRQAVLLLLVQPLQHGHRVDAGLGVTFELLNHAVLLHGNVLLHFIVGDGEVEFLLQGDDHAAEVLADEVVEQLGAGVSLVDFVFGEDLVGEVGAGFEGEFFAKDEGVIAVEEDFGNLFVRSANAF